MHSFTAIDGIVLAIIIISGLLAYWRGFIREAMAIGGWIAAAICGFYYADLVRPWASFIPIIGDLVSSECEVSLLTGFVLVFLPALIIAYVLTGFLSGLVRGIALGAIDQGLGFLFGIARAFVLITVVFIIYNTVTRAPVPIVQNSYTYEFLVQRLPNNISSDWINSSWQGIESYYEQFFSTCKVDSDLNTPNAQHNTRFFINNKG